MTDRDKVGPVASERETFHFVRDLVGGHLEPGANIPDVYDSVVHVADRDEQAGRCARREADEIDGEIVTGHLGHLHLLAHVPYAHFGHVAALTRGD